MFKNLDVPKESELHHWADYVEIRCLSDQDQRFSGERLLAQLVLARDLQEATADAQDATVGDLMDLVLEGEGSGEVGLEDFADSQRFEDESPMDHESDIQGDVEVRHRQGDDDDEVHDWRNFGREAERADNRDLWSRRIFLLLSDRAESLGEVYPFAIDSATMTIALKEENALRLKYVFYLACASLSRFDKADQAALTACFEATSATVLNDMLPGSFEVDLFGTARGDGGSRFRGSLYERIQQLADTLRATVTCESGDFHPNDSADNGLDIAAWLPMTDAGKGVPAFFCQCACGAKWESKQFEANYARWRSFIDLASPPAAITFIPHHFRKWGEKWYAAADVSDVLIDRLRAIRVSPSPLEERARSLASAAWTYTDLGS